VENTAVPGSYGRFRAWVLAQDPGGSGSGSAPASEIAFVDRDRRAVWFRRMWKEGERPEREISLRVFAGLQPGEAGSLFREILASEGAPLWERTLALELLRGVDPGAGGGEHEASLTGARQCVEALLRSPGDGDGKAAVGEVHASFYALPRALQGAVAAEVLEQDPDRAVSFLGGVLRERESLWEVVLEPLVRSPHPGSAELIRDGYRRTRDRSLQKRMKKSNHQRRVLGLAAIPLEEGGGRRSIWTPPVPTRPEGLLAVAETPEEKLVWILRRNVSVGMLVFTGWVHARLGLGKFLVMDVSRTDAKNYVGAVLQNREIKAGPADPGYCAFLLEEAYKRGAPEDAEEADAYRRVRMMVTELLPAGEAPPPHPVHAVLAAEAGKGAGDGGPPSAQDVAQVLDHPLLQGFRLEDHQWKSRQDQLEEILGSRIIVHPLQKRDRIETFYRQVAAEVFADPEERRRWKTRLEDAAWAVHHGGDRDLAGRLVRVGLALETPEEDPGRNRFCMEVVRRTLDARVRQSRDEKRETPSLIVRPS